MSNVYRRFLDVQALYAILRRHGVDSPLSEHTVLDGGTFNTVYRLRFADRPGIVLKLSPDPAGAAMTYEHGIVRTESDFYTLAGQRDGVPVPEVIGVEELGPEHGGGQALLVTELPGTPWYGSGLPAQEEPRLRTELGRIVASMHAIHGPAFGYPSESTGPLTPRWVDAFTAMMDAVLADGERYQAKLPVAPVQVRRLLRGCQDDLAAVLVPSLVHFDLWPGNVLVDFDAGAGVNGSGASGSGASGPRVSGIIDGERALWGDPVVDFVSLALFAEIRDDEGFIRGYQESGTLLPLDLSARRRLLLYRIYLGLIMNIEPIPRGGNTTTELALDLPSGSADGYDHAATVTAQLTADLAELERILRVSPGR